jgi:transposase
MHHPGPLRELTHRYGRAGEAASAAWLYLPPYSSDCSPVENCWSKLKTFLRAAKALTREVLDRALKQALDTVPNSQPEAGLHIAAIP